MKRLVVILISALACGASAGDREAFKIASVTLFALGAKRPAFVDLTDAMRRGLSFEACEPVRYAPAKGLSAIPTLAVRPGEKAALRLRFRGTLADPRGVLENAVGETVDVRLPCTTKPLSGTWRLRLEDSAADVELDLVKDY